MQAMTQKTITEKLLVDVSRRHTTSDCTFGGTPQEAENHMEYHLSLDISRKTIKNSTENVACGGVLADTQQHLDLQREASGSGKEKSGSWEQMQSLTTFLGLLTDEQVQIDLRQSPLSKKHIGVIIKVELGMPIMVQSRHENKTMANLAGGLN